MNKLDVINRALLKCGLPLAADIADCDWNAAFVLDSCAEEVLRQFTWGFARKIAPLQQVEACPGWRRSYALPGDYLRAVDVHACGNMRSPKATYEVVGTQLHCNVSPCYLRYIHKGAAGAVESWPPDFADTVAARVAVEIAGLSTQMDMAAKLYQMYAAALANAQATDARENAERVPHDWNIMLSRGGYGERRGRQG